MLLQKLGWPQVYQLGLAGDRMSAGLTTAVRLSSGRCSDVVSRTIVGETGRPCGLVRSHSPAIHSMRSCGMPSGQRLSRTTTVKASEGLKLLLWPSSSLVPAVISRPSSSESSRRLATTFPRRWIRSARITSSTYLARAVCGQLAGAYWGETGIPDQWLSGLAGRDMIEKAIAGLLS